MLGCRKYRESVILFRVVCTPDDFGKRQVSERTEVLRTFAEVIQTNSSRLKYEGVVAQQTAYTFRIRYTDVEFNIIQWQGVDYTVNSIENVNQRNKELVIYAQVAQ